MTRHLTEQEINTILNDIQLGTKFPEVTNEIITRIKKYCTIQLKQIQIYPELIPKLKQQIETQFVSSQVQPGESVGILSAQSIGERQTQLTLNSFHSSGLTIATVVTGVPRFEELLRATKNPKSAVTKVYFKQKYSSFEECKRAVEYELLYIEMKDLIVKTKRRFTEYPWQELYSNIHNIDLDKHKFGMSVAYNLQTLYKHRIKLNTLHK